MNERTHAELATDMVSAFVSRNVIEAKEVPDLYRRMLAAVKAGAVTPKVPEPEKVREHAVRNSITPDALISFIDGKPYKMLRRHLAKYKLTPEQYRDQYGLGEDYPMVAANYSQRRVELAKTQGLGRNKAP